MSLAFVLSILAAIALAVHVVRTGRPLYWVWVILIFQPLGGLVYFLAIVLPELMGGPTARRIGGTARAALDPNREYREAKAASDETPTAGALSRLAAAAAKLGRHDEAEALFASAAQGVHADDPVILLGQANALIELSRPDEALAVLERAHAAGGGDAGDEALAQARALEALGRTEEADDAYRRAVEALAGFEALGRYAAFLARTDRKAEAKEIVTDLDRRIAKGHPQFRKEGRVWRDLAAQALA